MKTDLWNNTEIKHRQKSIIPKGKNLVCIPEIRAWIFVPEALTKVECEARKVDYLRRYNLSLNANLFKGGRL